MAIFLVGLNFQNKNNNCMNKNIITRLILTAILLFVVSLSASSSNEPDTHLGWTLTELQSKFPTLLKIEENGNTVVYALGEDSEVGVSWYYVLKNNVVCTEIWNVRSKDSEAIDLFKKMVKGFALLCKEKPTFPNENEVHFKLETYTVDMSYGTRPNGVNQTIMKYNLIIK